jgi:two-component system, LytTR family, sensor kinase
MRFFWKYLFPPLYGLFFYTILRLVSDLTDQFKFWKRSLRQNLSEIVGVILFSYLLVRIPHYFLRKFTAKTGQPQGRAIFLEFAQVLLTAMVMATVASVVVHVAANDYPIGIDDLVIVNVLMSLFMLLHYAILRGNSFIKAYIEQKVLVEKVRNDQLLTELKFLKAQYHPHFLFNALNTIYFQMDEDVSAAKLSVEKFSELLRYQLYDQQQTVPVSQEIRYLANFIQLQQTRASEKLRLTVHFDQNLDGQQVYPLLFLPLVENAFKYVGGDYYISVNVGLQDSTIRLEVENGVPADIPLKKVNKVKNEGGIGLENLKRRLELLYPDKHTLTAQKKENTFVAVLILKLPEVAALRANNR